MQPSADLAAQADREPADTHPKTPRRRLGVNMGVTGIGMVPWAALQPPQFVFETLELAVGIEPTTGCLQSRGLAPELKTRMRVPKFECSGNPIGRFTRRCAKATLVGVPAKVRS
jgi:hypothetical protein